jgi:hypothetical protein
LQTQSPYGFYSWNDVRGYFYDALTAPDQITKERKLAETFRGLGQLMHLVQDMSVPEHTRDDGHYIGSTGLATHYEQWVARTKMCELTQNKAYFPLAVFLLSLFSLIILQTEKS